MQGLNRKKKRLRIVMMAAASLGCSSATVGGTLSVPSWSAPPAALAPARMA